ncbi:unnamed protein product [Alopecurus aequalis]
MHGHHWARAVNGAAPKRKGSAKENGSLRHAGTKPPRGGLPRPCSSGGMEAVVLPNAAVSASQSRSSEQAVASDRDDDAPMASPPTPFVRSGNGNGATGAGTKRAASREAECDREVVNSAEGVEGGEAEAKNAVVDVEKREGQEIAVQSPEAEAKLGNGEITSDSETEPSYVFINKKDEKPMRLSDALAGSDDDAEAELQLEVTGDADVVATREADADTAAEIATTENAESCNEMSSFSGTGRSGRGSGPSSPPSCSSRAQSIERLLEEDAALLQKKREDRSVFGRRSVQAVSTPPGSAGRRASGAARTTSPRGTGMGFKKRFLSFGKKTRGTDGATVIECTSPASVPVSPADYGGGERRRCRNADDSISPRLVGCSSNADDTEHSYGSSSQACSLQSLVAASPAKSEMSEMVPQEKSPKSHRSFFSFRSFNCGRS